MVLSLCPERPEYLETGGSVEASVDLDDLLERYSDRLVGLVMDKMSKSGTH